MIRLHVGYRWPADCGQAAADYIDRYPPPPLTDEQVALVESTFREAIDQRVET